MRGLDLAITAGCIYGLLGLNGAGKTTTLRAMVGLVRPNEGRVVLFGKPCPADLPCVIERMGVYIDGVNLNPAFSGRNFFGGRDEVVSKRYDTRVHEPEAARIVAAALALIAFVLGAKVAVLAPALLAAGVLADLVRGVAVPLGVVVAVLELNPVMGSLVPAGQPWLPVGLIRTVLVWGYRFRTFDGTQLATSVWVSGATAAGVLLATTAVLFGAASVVRLRRDVV